MATNQTASDGGSQPKRFDGDDSDLELPDREVDQFRRFPQDASTTTDDDGTDEEVEDCSLGTVLDFLVEDGIVGCNDPSLTLSVTHITDDDIEKLNAFGWSAMIHNDGDKTYLSLHKK